MSSTNLRPEAGPEPVLTAGPGLPAGSESDAGGVSVSVRVAAAWSWRLIAILAGVVVAGWLLSYFTSVWIPVLLAALLAGLVSPAVKWLRSKHFPSFLAAAVVELGLIAVVLGLLTLAGQQIILGFSQLSDSAMRGINTLVGMLEDLPFDISTDTLNDWVDQAFAALQNNSSTIVSGAISFGSTAGTIVTGMVIMLFTLLFFLADGEKIWLFLVRLFPRPSQPAINGAGRRGWLSLVQYVRIQGFVAMIDAIGIGLGAAILGVPLAVPLGILVFLGSFIPLVGAIVTGAIAVLVALVANGPWIALAMLGVVLLVQQVESNVLQPLIMGKAVSLHPLAVFLAVATGSVTAGILGALFSVPLLAVINSVVRYLAGQGWRNDPDIAWQPYYFPWEIRKLASKQELTREQVLQQFRRFSRSRHNEEASEHNKEVEKATAEHEKELAVAAAETIQDSDPRREELLQEQVDDLRESERSAQTHPPTGAETSEAARLPTGLGRDLGRESDERIVGNPNIDPQDFPQERPGSETGRRGGEDGADNGPRSDDDGRP
ncbi:AI-2E family transporter [Kocuria coralli]|uniref:AI-2E family transporter n=1 Tax=Kocuria coralli TaxID=1461025 RepID=A0A5J5L0B3_9MICC|nr:AI-2E family transporter [Kocuria coralli]KAA9394625.1 AI-2E family transporter [Kocuria coralli]